MKITLDIKSLIIGFMASALIIMGLSFKNAPEDKPGKFKISRGTLNKIIILDTESGAYIMSDGMVNKRRMDWTRGDFASSYQYAAPEGLQKN
ncbi:hypothetical protein [Pedobacter gandavensis]|uniref:hypothetical protein n=1 Tax=Pedobacter gandavensis TaxID=2679963 RepID=UPI00292D775E|nr:hypothetical protein [Pedobacter gandavensis]